MRLSVCSLGRIVELSLERRECLLSCAQLSEFFARQRTGFTLPLDACGTEFQLLAWSALSHIPFGSTSSYSQVPCTGVRHC